MRPVQKALVWPSAATTTPVTFTELTTDQEFWKGCETCQYFDVLQRSGNKNCLCTGMIFDPTPKTKWKRKKSSSLSLAALTPPMQ